MAVRPIRQLGDPVLRQPCRPVVAFDDKVALLVEDLIETCRLPGRAGLAAPQVGVSLAVFSYNVGGVEGYVVNPTLVSTEGTQEGEEGCLSIPGIHAETPRAERAVVTGFDVDGAPIEVGGTGLMARCLQHETDHLDGVLYIDRLDRQTRKAAMAAIREANIDGAGSS
ncbi:MAG: peptide deformylase [Actinomycetota bacterium]|nr:peptide deformylase [Actinomycetota bacterium]